MSADTPVFRYPWQEIHVTGGDYSYDGWLVAAFTKTKGGVRYVVEDVNGRLFIHNAKQIGKPEGWWPE